MKAAVFLSLLVSFGAVLLAGCNSINKIESLVIEPVAIDQVADGTYRGIERHFPVTAVVEVAVAGGVISDIELKHHFHGPDHGADDIIPQVIAAQSLEVDAISGSTYSSTVVLKAIENALREGL
jgi:uncharacterized protein with FMN-binding domain